jgi:hypothetical protein
MESIKSRKERIRTIESINIMIEKYQGRSLSVSDFDMLIELDQEQLVDVYNSMREQVISIDYSGR